MHLGALLTSALGLKGASAFKVESACSSGGSALHVAYSLVASELTESALVVGVEKMTDLEADEVSSALCMAESYEFTQFFGVSFVAMNALLTRRYMHEYDATSEQLASFPVNTHQNAVTAEHA